MTIQDTYQEIIRLEKVGPPQELLSRMERSNGQISSYIIDPTQQDEVARWVPIIVENSHLPCIDGLAIWERLPWETHEQFKLFAAYRAMGCERTNYKVAQQYAKDPTEIVQLNRIMQWKHRATMYDTYEVGIHEYRILERQRAIADSHYHVAQDLFDKCAGYCSQNIDQFAPKDIIALLKLSADLGKSSVGYLMGATGSTTSARHQAATASPGHVTVNIQQQQLAAGPEWQQNQTASAIAHDQQFEATTGVLSSQNPELEVTVVPQLTDLDKERERLAGIINVLHTIGALEVKESVVEQLNEDEIILK